jgi:CRISPR system Cascade subunit CasA
MPPPFSLLTERWLPVRRASGARSVISPAGVTEDIDRDPVVAFDWPRPDFDAAARELLIGLLSTACWREALSSRSWGAWWRKPPTPGELAERFAPFSRAFELDGAGPRFLQDLDRLEDRGIENDAGALLIDIPSHFVRRAGHLVFDRATAAMALFTLQCFAPAGGRGNLTSLRGGGPMTTLVLPGEADTPLWQILWLNALWDKDWSDPAGMPEKVFPWLAPTRVSDKGVITTPRDVHPAQAWWGMPRRIRLAFAANRDGVPCGLTGRVDSVIVTGYLSRPSGTKYAAWSLGHPLTPYYRVKKTDVEWLPLHPQPERRAYRDWIGLVISDADGAEARRAPARVVGTAGARLSAMELFAPRLLAAGFDMDNRRLMKPRGFVESEMPLPVVSDAVRESFDLLVRSLVSGAREAAGLVSLAVGKSLSSGELPDAGKSDRQLARDRFWDRTEAVFYEVVSGLPARLTAAVDDRALQDLTLAVSQAWFRHLRATVLPLFDELVPLDDIEARAVERLVGARRDLITALNGRGKGGQALYGALGLPLPDGGKKKDKGGKAA